MIALFSAMICICVAWKYSIFSVVCFLTCLPTFFNCNKTPFNLCLWTHIHVVCPFCRLSIVMKTHLHYNHPIYLESSKSGWIIGGYIIIDLLTWKGIWYILPQHRRQVLRERS